MLAEIHRGKHIKQFEWIHPRDPTDIQHAISEIRLRRDAHAIAIELRVSECGQESEPFGRNLI